MQSPWVCRKHGISAPTYYAWKSKYAGATVSDLTRMRELEAENARLKRMYADLALENAAIKDVLAAVREAAGGLGHGDRASPAGHTSLQSRRLVAGGVRQTPASTRAGRWISCTTCSTTAGGSAPST